MKLFNLNAQNTSEGIKLTWEKDPTADFYIVYRATNMRFIDEMKFRLRTNSNTNEAIDTLIEPDKSYSYIVQAITYDNELTYSCKGASEAFEVPTKISWDFSNYDWKNIDLTTVYVGGGAYS